MLDRTAFTTTTLPPLVEPTEDAIALAFAEHYAERFAYDHTHGAWLRWDDEAGVWRADTVAYVPDCVRSFGSFTSRWSTQSETPASTESSIDLTDGIRSLT